YTLEHFDQKTRRAERYTLKGKRLNGFNALFATSSIEAARMYYNAFQEVQSSLPSDKRLIIGLIYSYAANEIVDDSSLDDEAFEVDALPQDARSFLDDAILDYNEMFGTSFDTNADNFHNYYKDL